MRHAITILLLLHTVTISSQEPTLKETQDWVKQKIELHEYGGDFTRDSPFYATNYVFFLDDSIMIVEIHKSRLDRLGFTYVLDSIFSIYHVPVKYMVPIEYRFFDKGGLGMIIKTKIGIAHKEPIICRIYKRKNGDYELIDIEEKFGFELRLGESFKEDDLPNRMKKALNHLIILSGGYVVKEVF